jgi:hypothetical protein
MESTQLKQASTGTPRPAPPARPLTARPVQWPDDSDVNFAVGNVGPARYKVSAEPVRHHAYRAFGDGGAA